jgi:hypothetical protein
MYMGPTAKCLSLSLRHNSHVTFFFLLPHLRIHLDFFLCFLVNAPPPLISAAIGLISRCLSPTLPRRPPLPQFPTSETPFHHAQTPFPTAHRGHGGSWRRGGLMAGGWRAGVSFWVCLARCPEPPTESYLCPEVAVLLFFVKFPTIVP